MKKYKSDILAMCHEEFEIAFRYGDIDEKKMREYDKDCLVNPKPRSRSLTKKVKPVGSKDYRKKIMTKSLTPQSESTTPL
jgi:hypothetical protein